MKLNPDCVRNILLTLEESDSYQAFMMFESGTVSKCSRLTDYSLEEVLYHLKKCDEAGFLTDVQYFPESVLVNGLH